MTDYAHQLQRYFAQSQPDAQVTQFQNITSGWENEVYAFTLVTDAGSRDLVLRVYPGAGAIHKAEREFHGMQHLFAVGFPVPEMIALEATRFGQPTVIMARVPGQTVMHLLADATGPERTEHITRFCDLFVQLHRVDWRPLAPQPDVYADENAANRQLIAHYRQMVTTTGMTGVLPVLDWVAAHKSALICKQPAIVHQDFHPDNLLWDGQKLKVIDWTAIAVLDPRIDLAWTLLLVGSYESMALRAQVLRLYEQAAQTRMPDIEVFEALAMVRRFNDLWQSANQGGESWGLRPEVLTAMRSQAAIYQQQYARLKDLTGLRVVELEELLATLSGAPSD